jgi:hypothetical protein
VAEAHLDHPGEIRWFKGWGPAPVEGDCPHATCPHESTAAIAYGPDFAHYILDVCEEPQGCAGACRGWFGEWPANGRYGTPGYVPRRYQPPTRWLHVPRPADAT